jgi:ParB-like chromosome segregation protein Spo0J
MSFSDSDADRVTDEIALDKLAEPPTDVREDRPDHELKKLAMSLEDNGQIQPALCYVDPDDVDLEGRDPAECELDWLVAQADEITVIDGWSRKLAAELIDWPSIRCEVYREPPEHETVVSLAANTDRIEMRDYGICQTLRDYKERTGITQAELAERVGYSAPTISKMFAALDAFEPAVQAWRSPETHVEMGHVLAIESCDFEQDKERVFQACMNHVRSVTETREDAKRSSKDTAAERSDGREIDERTADGAAAAAEREVEAAARQQEQSPPCLVCGQDGTTKVAIDVCPEDRGAIIQKKEAGEPLIQPAEGPPPDQPPAGDRPPRRGD